MRRLSVLLLAAALLSIPTTTAHGAAPTCAEELGIAAHGQHIVGDYVMGTGHDGEWPPKDVGSTIAGSGAAMPGGPGPGFHFPNGFAPGASFCNDQSRSPGLHF